MTPKFIVRTCEACGRQFLLRGYRLKQRRGRFCSHRCRGAGNRTHGETIGGRTAEYRTWRQMKTRCLNLRSADFANYGGRGVGIYASWACSFESFFADMGRRPSPQHSLDRWPNPHGNYEPGNCRWATPSQQANNRRNTIRYVFRGERKTITEIAEAIGIKRETLKARLRRMSFSEAIRPNWSQRDEELVG